jgi:hypothetical protein
MSGFLIQASLELSVGAVCVEFCWAAANQNAANQNAKELVEEF